MRPGYMFLVCCDAARPFEDLSWKGQAATGSYSGT
jgi:hypothetical protein